MGSSGKLIVSADIVDGTIATADIQSGAISQGASAQPTPAQTTTSTTLATMTGPTAALTTTGGMVLVAASGNIQGSAATSTWMVSVAQDGVASGEYAWFTVPAANYYGPFGITILYLTPTAAAHTYTLQWRTTAGTLTLNSARIIALEIKK